MIYRKLLALMFGLLMQGLACHAVPIIDGASLKDHIDRSTTNTKARVHVVFEEHVASFAQTDWTNGFGASVTLYVDGAKVGSYAGSTLPSAMKVSSTGYVFSLLRSSCNLQSASNRFYTWQSSQFVGTSGATNKCLRLPKITPSAVIGTERKNDAIVWKIPSIDKHYAENILIHAGRAHPSFDGDRGSDGCLTVKQWSAFLQALGTNSAGTLEVLRYMKTADGQETCF